MQLEGNTHRHSWRDVRVTSTFRGISIMAYPSKRVLQKCNRCGVEREQIRNAMGVIAWLQDKWYGRKP